MAFQSIWAALLNAVTLGIVFARISQPKQRARTIFISDSAVVARRDGILKFMFRIADIRNTQVRMPAAFALLNPLFRHEPQMPGTAGIHLSVLAAFCMF